uniref:hypothetical protein n=1 Tax=Acetobacter tropicalis TaxID=104102 RepID=UPI0038D17490
HEQNTSPHHKINKASHSGSLPGSDCRCGRRGKRRESFYPRSRTGSDRMTRNLSGKITVSIHAPARGATLVWITSRADLNRVSIHAPARGATANTATL